MLTTAPRAETPIAPASQPGFSPASRPLASSRPATRAGLASRPLTKWVECSHTLSGLPCMNHQPHAGGGRGCVHYSTSGVPDRHDYGDDE